MGMTLRAPALGAAALLMVVLGGCGGGDDPPGDPDTPSASSSSEVTSTTTETTAVATGPVEPTWPAEAADDTKVGAEAFVRFYWKVVNFATKTGDLELLRKLNQPSCDTCRAGISGIARIYAVGGQIVGGDYALGSLEAVQSASGRWTVVVRTEVEEQRAIGAGKLNRTYPAGNDRWLMALTRIQDTWSVTTLESL